MKAGCRVCAGPLVAYHDQAMERIGVTWLPDGDRCGRCHHSAEKAKAGKKRAA